MIHFVKFPKGLDVQEGYKEWIICKFYSGGVMVMEEWAGINPKNKELEKEDLSSEKFIHKTGIGKFNLHPKSKEIRTK